MADCDLSKYRIMIRYALITDKALLILAYSADTTMVGQSLPI